MFYDVVKHSIGEMFGDVIECSSHLRIENRLKHVGFELLKNLLIPRCVSLMRITAAEAISFPELATMAYSVSYEGSVNICAITGNVYFGLIGVWIMAGAQECFFPQLKRFNTILFLKKFDQLVYL